MKKIYVLILTLIVIASGICVFGEVVTTRKIPVKPSNSEKIQPESSSTGRVVTVRPQACR